MPNAVGKARTVICRRCGHVANSSRTFFMNRQVPTVHTRVGNQIVEPSRLGMKVHRQEIRVRIVVRWPVSLRDCNPHCERIPVRHE